MSEVPYQKDEEFNEVVLRYIMKDADCGRELAHKLIVSISEYCYLGLEPLEAYRQAIAAKNTLGVELGGVDDER